MPKVNLKDNIFIEGFDNELDVYDRSIDLCIDLGNFSILYEGKTSEIPEELLDFLLSEDCPKEESHYNYKDFLGNLCIHTTAKESIQSACDKEYCIIYKTN